MVYPHHIPVVSLLKPVRNVAGATIFRNSHSTVMLTRQLQGSVVALSRVGVAGEISQTSFVVFVEVASDPLSEFLSHLLRDPMALGGTRRLSPTNTQNGLDLGSPGCQVWETLCVAEDSPVGACRDSHRRREKAFPSFQLHSHLPRSIQNQILPQRTLEGLQLRIFSLK